MVRNVNSGFSFVKVKTSMVLLAFVTLLIGLILITTSMSSHRESYPKDDAYAIAREKLAELQQDPETKVQPSGIEAVTRDNVVYTMSWNITDIENAPDRADIIVKWNKKMKIKISGFIISFVGN